MTTTGRPLANLWPALSKLGPALVSHGWPGSFFGRPWSPFGKSCPAFGRHLTCHRQPLVISNDTGLFQASHPAHGPRPSLLPLPPTTSPQLPHNCTSRLLLSLTTPSQLSLQGSILHITGDARATHQKFNLLMPTCLTNCM